MARAEGVEAVAAVEIAAEAGDARREAVADVIGFGNELYLMLSALIR